MKPDIRKLTPNDIEQLVSVREIAFLDSSSPDDEEVRYRHERRLPHSKGLFVGATLSSAATVYPLSMYLGGKLVAMGGLASVQSAVEYRRRGHVKALLHDWLEELKNGGVGFCLEFPFDPRYYARFGWQSVANGVTLSFPADLLLSKKVEAKRLLAPAAPAELKPIYDGWARNYNGALSRSDDSVRNFNHVLQRPWEARPRPVYLLDEAYCVVEIKHEDGVTVTVADYAYSSPRGRKNLLAFLGLFSGQAKTLTVHLPADDPLVAELQPYLKPNNVLQARIIDVKHALSALTADAEGRFSLRVSDDFCNWNNQTFLLEFEGGRVSFKPWGQTPDVSTDVRVLTALVMGALSAEAALQTGLFNGKLEHAKALASLSGGREFFMPRADYF